MKKVKKMPILSYAHIIRQIEPYWHILISKSPQIDVFWVAFGKMDLKQKKEWKKSKN